MDTAIAARTAARLAFLVEGLRRGDAALLAEAAGDELHEKRRAHLSPLTGALVAAAREAGAAHAAWSGAGPSAVALVSDGEAAGVRAAWEGLLAAEGGAVLEPGLDRRGLSVGRPAVEPVAPLGGRWRRGPRPDRGARDRRPTGSDGPVVHQAQEGDDLVLLGDRVGGVAGADDREGDESDPVAVPEPVLTPNCGLKKASSPMPAMGSTWS